MHGRKRLAALLAPCGVAAAHSLSATRPPRAKTAGELGLRHSPAALTIRRSTRVIGRSGLSPFGARKDPARCGRSGRWTPGERSRRPVLSPVTARNERPVPPARLGRVGLMAQSPSRILFPVAVRRKAGQRSRRRSVGQRMPRPRNRRWNQRPGSRSRMPSATRPTTIIASRMCSGIGAHQSPAPAPQRTDGGLVPGDGPGSSDARLRTRDHARLA